MLKKCTYRWHKSFSLALLLVLVVLFGFGAILSGAAAAPATDASPFMPVSQLREGMRGIGKTVFHGTTIEEFDVEILSVLPDFGPSGDAILAKVSSEVLDKAGGVVQGMSGSPVYVDGRLIGAISGAFRNNPDGLAVITPIESMLHVLDRVQPEEDGPLKRAGQWKQLSTPLLASGLSPRALRTLTESTKEWGMHPVEGGGIGRLPETPDNPSSVRLEPGAALGMQWVRGDVNVMSVGTVTYVDGRRFVAFGHTAGAWGDISAFASTAYVNAIVKSQDIGFKLASPLDAVGTISQDRFAAVAGTVGKLPPTVDYEVKVHDKDSGKRSEFHFEVVRDEQFTNRFSASALLGVLDRAIDRLGPGTSRVVYRVYVDGMEPIVRDNLFYSNIDISAVSLTEVLELSDLLLGNEFKAVNLEKVELEVEVDSSRQTAVIEKVQPDRRTVSPGESVNVEVIIRPFRGRRETKIVRLDIPEGVQPGTVHVTVRGGGWGYLLAEKTPYHEELNGKEREKPEDAQPPTNAESLDKLIKDLVQRPRYQDLVVEFVPYLNPYGTQDGNEAAVPASGSTDTPQDDEGGGSGVSANMLARGYGSVPVSGGDTPSTTEGDDWNEQQPEPVRSVLATQYCLEGELGFELNIVAPPEASETIREDEASQTLEEDADVSSEVLSKEDKESDDNEGSQPNSSDGSDDQATDKDESETEDSFTSPEDPAAEAPQNPKNTD